MVCYCETCSRRQDEYNKKKTDINSLFNLETCKVDQEYLRKRQSLESSRLSKLRELEEATRRQSELDECKLRRINAQPVDISVREWELKVFMNKLVAGASGGRNRDNDMSKETGERRTRPKRAVSGTGVQSHNAGNQGDRGGAL